MEKIMRFAIRCSSGWPYLGLLLALLILGGFLLSGSHFDASGMVALLIVAVMLYQFELHVLPGGFNHWLNKTVFFSRIANTPLNRRRAFIIDVVFSWGMLGVAALLIDQQLWLMYICLFLFLNRGWFHLSSSIAAGCYSPGVVTGTLLFIPLSWYAIYAALSDQWLGWQGIAITAVIGTLLHGVFFKALRYLAWKDAIDGLKR
jgi:hypothetical protein